MASGLLLGWGVILGATFHWTALPIVIIAIGIWQLLTRRRSWMAVIVVAVACVIGAWRAESTVLPATSLEHSVSSIAIGRVVSVPTAGGQFERSILDLEEICVERTCSPAHGRVIIFLPPEGEGIAWRDRVRVDWSFMPLEQIEPSYGAYVQTQGAIGSAWVSSYVVLDEGPAFFHRVGEIRRAIADRLRATIPGDAGALASGIVTGDDAGLSADVEEAFTLTGTRHITAVSGQNVSLLIGAIAMWHVPMSGRQRVIRDAVLLLVIWTYTLMVGLEPPAVRAAGVASLMTLGGYTGRRRDPQTLLSLVAAALVLLEPLSVERIGFWLSLAASVALCSMIPLSRPESVLGYLRPFVFGPMMAGLATLPFVLTVFGSWSPISIIANASIGPIVTAAFPVSFFFAFVMWVPGVPMLFSWAPGILLDLVISIVMRWGERAPEFIIDHVNLWTAFLIALPCFLVIALCSIDARRWIVRADGAAHTPSEPDSVASRESH